MIIFATSRKNAPQILKKMQCEDLENCYISPDIAFSHLPQDLPEDAIIALRLDLLSVADKLICVGEPNDLMQEELEFATLVGMEVEQIESGCV